MGRDILQALLILLLASNAARGTGPAQVGRQVAVAANLELLAAGGLLAAAAHGADGEARDEVKGLWPFDHTADVTNVYGGSAFNLPAAALLWSAGSLTRHPALRAVGSDLTRTLLTVQALVGPVKLLTRRERPDGSNSRSFPSGHAANAFAVARLMHLRRGARAGLPLYGVAALTAVGRLADDRHYLSDVVMGAACGAVAANSAVWADRQGRALTLAPLPGASGLVVQWSL